jgi:HlyD family secretion protein
VDAFPNERFEGVVKAVRYAPKTVQNVVTYDAVVSVENPALKLRPGMTADVSFLVEELSDTLLVPNAALRFRPPGAGAQPQANAAGGAPPGADGANGAARQRRPGGGETANAGGPRRGSRRAVWVVAPDGALREVQIQTGPSDGKSTAVLGGELAAGDRVVTGLAGDAGATPAAAQNRRPGFGRFL